MNIHIFTYALSVKSFGVFWYKVGSKYWKMVNCLTPVCFIRKISIKMDGWNFWGGRVSVCTGRATIQNGEIVTAVTEENAQWHKQAKLREGVCEETNKNVAVSFVFRCVSIFSVV